MRQLAVLLLATTFPVLVFGQDLPETYPPLIDQGDYYLEFTPVDSTQYPDPPSPSDSTSSTDYSFLESLTENREVWKIALTASDDTVYVDPKAHSSTRWHLSFSFLDYYPEHELILFKSRWDEYSRYVIVARRTGKVAVAFGPPVFSPSGEWFITMGSDTVSGWSPHGLQLFAVDKGRFSEVIHFRTGDVKFRKDRRSRQRNMGGPSRCRWIDDNTFQLEMLKKHLGPGQTDSYKHYRVNVVKADN